MKQNTRSTPPPPHGLWDHLVESVAAGMPAQCLLQPHVKVRLLLLLPLNVGSSLEQEVNILGGTAIQFFLQNDHNVVPEKKGCSRSKNVEQMFSMHILVVFQTVQIGITMLKNLGGSCSLSLWRVARGSKLRRLELIHSLFIT
jgi:hypothetical protein